MLFIKERMKQKWIILVKTEINQYFIDIIATGWIYGLALLCHAWFCSKPFCQKSRW